MTWQQHAACIGADTDWWFPPAREKGVNPFKDQEKLRKARRICASCPVATECLLTALANNEYAGIWGNTSNRQRRALRVAPLCAHPLCRRPNHLHSGLCSEHRSKYRTALEPVAGHVSW